MVNCSTIHPSSLVNMERLKDENVELELECSIRTILKQV